MHSLSTKSKHTHSSKDLGAMAPSPPRSFLRSLCAFFIFLTIPYASLVLHEKFKFPRKNNLSKTKEKSTENFFYQVVGKDKSSSYQKQNNITEQTYTLHLGTFKDKIEALSVMKKAQKAGLKPFIIPVQQGPQVVFHVRVGFYKNKEEALLLTSKLLSQKLESQIMSL